MATPRLKDALAVEALALIREHGTAGAASRSTGIPESTLKSRARVAVNRKLSPDDPPPLTPDFPPKDIPYTERRELQGKSFETRRASYQAHTWFEIAHPDLLPVGYAFIGDQHGDDDGHNVPQFDRDMDILAKAEGVQCVNMGDALNNWPAGGKLASKWADQRQTRKDGFDFIRWMADQPVNWRVWLMGNHEGFGADTEELIREILREHDIIVHKWEARFRVTFPNGRQCFVRVAHDYKGSSWFHELHGNIRALMACPAHITVAGHHHDHAYMRRELSEIAHLMNAGLPFIAHLLRVRGYKHMDDYALVKGFPEHQEGASALCVIDPLAERGGQFVRTYMDLEEGCEALKRLRAKRRKKLEGK